MRSRLTLIAAASVLTVGLASPAAAAAQTTYEIRITNLTRGQILSPAVVAVHEQGTAIFQPGHKASPSLAAMAEDADASGLMADLGADPKVTSVQLSDGVILPGTTTSLEVTASDGMMLSLVAMLVTTNDAFVGVDGYDLSHVSGRSDFYATAWDAGSEANTESCADIPGPPCGSPGMRVTRGAEKYVHIHAGVRGDADLTMDYDWRNPVARIVVIER